MRYGMPYKGSKSRIAEELIRQLPPAKHFYDVFGGGGAMAHCAALSGKYQIVHYNEPNPLVCRGFQMAIEGQFRNEDRWISREDFFRLKKSDPYVALCWSFGNNMIDYLYSRKIEPLKRALHHAVAWDDWEPFGGLWPDVLTRCRAVVQGVTDRKQRRLNITKQIKSIIGQKSIVQSLQSLERLQSLESLQRLERLEITSKSYDELEFEEDAVIYCDPPYEGARCEQYEF